MPFIGACAQTRTHFPALVTKPILHGPLTPITQVLQRNQGLRRDPVDCSQIFFLELHNGFGSFQEILGKSVRPISFYPPAPLMGRRRPVQDFVRRRQSPMAADASQHQLSTLRTPAGIGLERLSFENIAMPLRARRLPVLEIKRRVVEIARVLHIEPLMGRRPRQLLSTRI